jgi:hypothetical protein
MSNQQQGGGKQSSPKPKAPEAKASDETKAQARDLPTDKRQGPKPKEEGETGIYHVAAGSKVVHEGKVYPAGAELLLAASYAKSLGGAVLPGESPKPDVPAERKAGKYRVADGVRMFHAGKLRGAGYTLELSAEEARQHGAAVTPV